MVKVRALADEAATDVAYELAGRLGADRGDSPFAASQKLLDNWSQLQERGPVVIVIEDVHWADPSSLAAVISAIKRLDRDRVAVIVASRVPPDEGWDRLILVSVDTDEVRALALRSGIELNPRQGRTPPTPHGRPPDLGTNSLQRADSQGAAGSRQKTCRRPGPSPRRSPPYLPACTVVPRPGRRPGSVSNAYRPRARWPAP